MPIHDFMCPLGHVTEMFVEHGIDGVPCCRCGSPTLATKVFLKFPMSFVQPDICYDSPIDGRIINSKQQRIEDLARSNCVPYDPDMKQDQIKQSIESEKNLEKSLDETIDREIALMPARKKEKLEGELRGGMALDFVRGESNIKPIKTEINL